ncbi:hypothetical protein PR048_025451 [Dryococelus australis]|uniref:Uncharacterized protein n=1 Tax=Dryococelus australis TaxID=614101 RepID=A0ABQ9GRA4_9NEOP|nr:hypothetical protein PR048_025451 [Dryococelus australis]
MQGGGRGLSPCDAVRDEIPRSLLCRPPYLVVLHQSSDTSQDLIRVKRGECGASPECESGGKGEIPEETRRSAASSGTILTCENSGDSTAGIEPGPPEASVLTTTPLRPHLKLKKSMVNVRTDSRLREDLSTIPCPANFISVFHGFSRPLQGNAGNVTYYRLWPTHSKFMPVTRSRVISVGKPQQVVCHHGEGPSVGRASGQIHASRGRGKAVISSHPLPATTETPPLLFTRRGVDELAGPSRGGGGAEARLRRGFLLPPRRRARPSEVAGGIIHDRSRGAAELRGARGGFRPGMSWRVIPKGAALSPPLPPPHHRRCSHLVNVCIQQGEDGVLWRRSTPTSRLDVLTLPPTTAARVKRGMERRGNAIAREETADPRENSPNSGIVRHDSHMRMSWCDPAGNRTLFALRGGKCSNRRPTATLTMELSLASSRTGKSACGRCRNTNVSHSMFRTSASVLIHLPFNGMFEHPTSARDGVRSGTFPCLPMFEILPKQSLCDDNGIVISLDTLPLRTLGVLAVATPCLLTMASHAGQGLAIEREAGEPAFGDEDCGPCRASHLHVYLRTSGARRAVYKGLGSRKRYSLCGYPIARGFCNNGTATLPCGHPGLPLMSCEPLSPGVPTSAAGVSGIELLATLGRGQSTNHSGNLAFHLANRGSDGAVARALASHHGDPGTIPGGSTSRSSHVEIVLNNAACQQFFSGYSRFPSPCIPAPLYHRVPVGKPVTRSDLPRPGFTLQSSLFYLANLQHAHGSTQIGR